MVHKKLEVFRVLRGIRQWFTLKRLILVLLGTGGLVTIVGIGTYEFIATTESSGFCGELCHTPMYPEYTTYQASPHSTVPCSSCHVGAGSYNLVTSKARGIPQIFETITGSYDRPIPSPVSNLRPASETCEKCHTTSRFTGFLVQTDVFFASDHVNTEKRNTIVLNVGGGTSGVANGIHWHTVSDVWYLPMDDQRLEIGWVGVEKDGVLTEYVNPVVADSITIERIEADKRLMDCIDCHNRASHVFRSPNDLINQAMAEKRIDINIPYIKKQALNAIGSPSSSLKEAYSKIDAVREFYQDSYPELFKNIPDSIERALLELEEIARLTTFPEMRVDWNTHADHSGHNKPSDESLTGLDISFNNWSTNQSEGCFRCHGKLVPTSETSTPRFVLTGESVLREPLDSDCNLCHYSLVSEPGSPVPGTIPHPTGGLENCLQCHEQSGLKPFPEDHPWTNNEACVFCHKAPERDIMIPATTPTLSQNIPHTSSGLEDCLLCHDLTSPVPLKEDHPWSTNETCIACHKTAPDLLPQPNASPPVGEIPVIPHSTHRLEDCLLCHGLTSPSPINDDHPWSTNETCDTCHKVASDLLPLSGQTSSDIIIPLVPHSTRGLENCLLCHGLTSSLPVNSAHPWSTNETCYACHVVSTQPAIIPPSINVASQVPHSIEGLSDCRLCHDPLGILPFPTNHISIPTSYCTFCHIH